MRDDAALDEVLARALSREAEGGDVYDVAAEYAAALVDLAPFEGNNLRLGMVACLSVLSMNKRTDLSRPHKIVRLFSALSPGSAPCAGAHSVAAFLRAARRLSPGPRTTP